MYEDTAPCFKDSDPNPAVYTSLSDSTKTDTSDSSNIKVAAVWWKLVASSISTKRTAISYCDSLLLVWLCTFFNSCSVLSTLNFSYTELQTIENGMTFISVPRLFYFCINYSACADSNIVYHNFMIINGNLFCWWYSQWRKCAHIRSVISIYIFCFNLMVLRIK